MKTNLVSNNETFKVSLLYPKENFYHDGCLYVIPYLVDDNIYESFKTENMIVFNITKNRIEEIDPDTEIYVATIISDVVFELNTK